MVSRTGIAMLTLLLSSTTALAHATPAACSERLLPPSPGAATGQGLLAARDLVELRDFGEVSISPDGRWAATILRRADATQDRYCIGLLLVSLSEERPPRLLDIGGEPLLVRGDLRGVADIVNGSIDDSGPVWSPDGRTIAYLRRDRGITQVWVTGLNGRPRQLTRLSEDARGVEWASPTAVRVKLRPGGDIEAGITREGRSGYLYDRRFWAISEVRPSPLPRPYQTITLDAATGRTLADIAEASEPGRPGDAQLFVRLPGGMAWTAPQKPLRYAGPSVLNATFGNRQLSCGEICSSRTAGLWALSPNTILFLRSGSTENGGRTQVYRWRLDRDPEPRPVLDTRDALFDCGLAGSRLICGRETALHPRALVAIDPDSGAMTTLYDPNPELPGRIRNTVERLEWTASDGVRSFGDLVLPPGHKPGQRHPLIIVQYISKGFLRGGVGDEYPIHLFAARGYAVLSISRPAPPSRASDATDIDSMQRVNVTGWADRRTVLASLEAGIDAVLARGVVDPARIGLTGLSDGSSTVQFALLNSNRFRAAATSTCCESAGALATVGLAYSDSTTKWGYPPPGFDDPAFWKPYSLAANAGQMRVPLLIQAADREYRLALETYAALDHAGSPIEMYVFPDEYHIKYHPEHRLAIYERNLAWFDFWLNGKISDDPGSATTMARWKALRDRASR